VRVVSQSRSARIALLTFVCCFDWYANAGLTAALDSTASDSLRRSLVAQAAEIARNSRRTVVLLETRTVLQLKPGDIARNSLGRFGLRMGSLGDSLSIGLSPVPGAEEVREEVGRTRLSLHDPVERLFFSLADDDRMLQDIAAGTPIRQDRLRPSQLKTVQELLTASEFDLFKSYGEVRCFISRPVAYLFLEGVFLETDAILNGSAAIRSAKQSQRMQDVDLSSLVGVARSILTAKQPISFSGAESLSLKELIKRIGSTGIVVSKLVENERIVVTAGRYKPAELLALAVFAAGCEFRRVSSLVHLAPRSDLYEGRRDSLAAMALSELWWMKAAPLLRYTAASPGSRFAPFDRSTVLGMRRIGFPSLTNEQRDFVLLQLNIPVSQSTLIPSGTECLIGPMIACDLLFRNNSRMRRGGGFGPRMDFLWSRWRDETGQGRPVQ